ncbi:MAG TPA: hypothetical protein DCX99_04355 [Oscillibacter sp.]|nr:hypothetical protein [Oscillibacter sp.]
MSQTIFQKLRNYMNDAAGHSVMFTDDGKIWHILSYPQATPVLLPNCCTVSVLVCIYVFFAINIKDFNTVVFRHNRNHLEISETCIAQNWFLISRKICQRCIIGFSQRVSKAPKGKCYTVPIDIVIDKRLDLSIAD